MSHITLIKPPLLLPSTASNITLGTPPVSLAYLAGSLLQAGHTTKIIDAFIDAPFRVLPWRNEQFFVNGLLAEEILEKIPVHTDFIGVSCMFSNEWIYYKTCLVLIRDSFPDIPIIVGGEHITADPEYVLHDCPAVDLCVLGEGEEALLEVIDNWGKDSIYHVNGLALRDKDGECMVRTVPRARIRNISSIPRPAWDLTKIEKYHSLCIGNDEITVPAMPIVASRGCPFQCTFCSNPNMYGNLWYARDVEDLIDEIKGYKIEYGVAHFEMYDLTAIVDRKWILRFTRRLLEEDLQITWAMPGGTRSEALTEDVLKLMFESGCRSIVYAPESGDANTLRRIKKRVSIKNMLYSMRLAVKIGFVIKIHIIYGLPEQSVKEMLTSCWLILKTILLGIHDANIFSFVPYPGSELYFQLVADGKIDRMARDYDLFLAKIIYTDQSGKIPWETSLSAKQLLFFTKGGMILFYILQFLIRPVRIPRALRNLYKRTPKTSFERIVMAILLRRFSKTPYVHPQLARSQHGKTTSP